MAELQNDEIGEYLDQIETFFVERGKCPQCLKKCSLYCCDCLCIVSQIPRIPTINLPINLHVILDDKPSKSTGVHLKLICPATTHVWMRNKDEIPVFDPETSIVIFPSTDSVPISSLGDFAARVQNVILLDCKWNNYGRNMTDPKLQNLKFVRLSNPPKSSRFWRWHNAGDGCISTIEATYCALRELFALRSQISTESQVPQTELIQLLFLFGVQRKIIQSHHTSGEGDDYCISDPTSDAFKAARRACNGLSHVKSSRLSKKRFNDDDDNSTIPFSGEDRIPYGSLQPVAPHVTSPLVISQEIISWLSIHLMNISSTRTVMYDLGCGDGTFIFRMLDLAASSEFTCIGLDFDSQLISEATSRQTSGRNNSDSQVDFRMCDIFQSLPSIAEEVSQLDGNVQLIIIYMFLVPGMLKSQALKRFVSDFLQQQQEGLSCRHLVISYGYQMNDLSREIVITKHDFLNLFFYYSS